jgi:predicted anti-sigma-YlaC factor YlaD
MDNLTDNEKEGIHTRMSCEAIRALIDKRHVQELNSAERDAVFVHTLNCRECRELNKAVLHEQIAALSKKVEEQE